jgi:hypothetical protein
MSLNTSGPLPEHSWHGGNCRRARPPKEGAYPEVLHFSTGLLPPRHLLHFSTALYITRDSKKKSREKALRLH